MISLMKPGNGADFLNVISLFIILFAATVPAFGNVIVPLTAIYASLKSDKLDFNIEVLNLIWLLVLYVQFCICITQFFCSKFRWLIWYIF